MTGPTHDVTAARSSHARPCSVASRIAALMLASLMVGLCPRPAVAQLELSLFGGLYAPLSDVGEQQVVVGFAGFGEDPETRPLGWKHEVGPAFGARLTLWLSDRLGTEVSLAYTPSDIQVERLSFSTTFPPNPPAELEASLLMASLRAIARFDSPIDAVSLHVLGGPGLISRGGRAYDALLGGGTSAALALGGGFRVRIGPKLLFRLDLESHLYETELAIRGPELQTRDGVISRQDTELGSHFQSDFVLVQALVLEL